MHGLGAIAAILRAAAGLDRQQGGRPAPGWDRNGRGARSGRGTSVRERAGRTGRRFPRGVQSERGARMQGSGGSVHAAMIRGIADARHMFNFESWLAFEATLRIVQETRPVGIGGRGPGRGGGRQARRCSTSTDGSAQGRRRRCPWRPAAHRPGLAAIFGLASSPRIDPQVADLVRWRASGCSMPPPRNSGRGAHSAHQLVGIHRHVIGGLSRRGIFSGSSAPSSGTGWDSRCWRWSRHSSGDEARRRPPPTRK